MLRDKIKWLSLGIFLFLNFLIWSQVLSYSTNRDLKVVFLDVGQGDAIFIEAPNGNQVLIDGGPDTSVLRELSKVMPIFDKKIDVLIATHPDADHIGGLVHVLNHFESELYIESGSRSDTLIYQSLEKSLKKEKIKRILARNNLTLDLGNGVYIDFLFPDRDVSGLESNTASIVSQIRYGQIEFMFSADSPISIEKYLVSIHGKNLESDILKVGHHGSKTSTSEIFLSSVNPTFAIISAGKDNKYNHPNQEVLKRLEAFGAAIFSTAESGNITFISDGQKIKVK